VWIPILKVNRLWSTESLVPAGNVVFIPGWRQTLYLFKVSSISKTLNLSELQPSFIPSILNQSPTTISSSVFPPTTSVSVIHALSPVAIVWLLAVVLEVNAKPNVDVTEDIEIVVGPSRNLNSPVPIPERLTRSPFCNPWEVDPTPTPTPFL